MHGWLNANVSQTETLPDVKAIDIQNEIEWFMRPYLLDFLVEAHAAFQLLPETLYLAVNLLDRYCSRRVVYKRHYQLVGCAALLIASKYGDRKDRVPTVKELKAMCCSLYEDEMFTQMEWHVLTTLDWLIGHPTLDGFLQLALCNAPKDPEVEHMAWYVSEISLFHKDFVSIRPSVTARSALALARYILGRPTPEQSDWSGRYDSVTVWKLSQNLSQPSPVLLKKYASPHLSSVANTITRLLQLQAQMVRQMAPPPTPPTDVGAFDGQKSGADLHIMPHTPQKVPYPTTMPYGYITPPITPDTDICGPGIYAKHNGVLPRNCPATPTPPSSVGAPRPYQQYQYTYSTTQPLDYRYYLQ